MPEDITPPFWPWWEWEGPQPRSQAAVEREIGEELEARERTLELGPSAIELLRRTLARWREAPSVWFIE